MFRSSLSLLFTILFCCAGAVAKILPVVHANFVFPVPAPTAVLSDWIAAPGRTIVSLDAENVTLRGWLYPFGNAGAPTVLVFGGNGYSIDDDDPGSRLLGAAGATVVAYDYRGYGFSTGTPDVEAIRADALRLYDKTVHDNKRKPVVVFGYSLGTLFAAYVSSRRAVRGVVLMAPPANAAEEYPFYSGAKPGSYRLAHDTVTAMNVEGMIARSKAPLLIVHGTADKVIAFAEGKEVFAASPASHKAFVAIDGAGHSGLPRKHKTIAALKQFLASLEGIRR